MIGKFIDLVSLDALTESDAWNDARSLLDMNDVTDAEYSDFVDAIAASYVNST